MIKNFNKKYLSNALVILITVQLIILGFIYFSNKNLSPDALAKQIQNDCAKAGHKENCYVDIFSDLIKKNDLKTTDDILDELNKLDSDSRGCHLISHVIAIGETDKNPEKWKDILKEINVNKCTGGYLHGVIEAHAKNEGGFKITSHSMQELCSIVGEELQGMGKQNCSHIMGHLALAQEIGDIQKAVTICDGTPSEIQYECYSGVFMENETRENLIVHAGFKQEPWTAKNTDKQKDICLQYDGVASVACWREISHMLIVTSAYQPQRLYDSCSEAPSRDAFLDCYFHGVSTLILYDIPEKVYPDLCINFESDDKLHKRCQSNIVGGLMTSSFEFFDKAAKFCDVFKGSSKNYCYGRIGANLALSNGNNKQELCGKLEGEIENACLHGVN